MIDEVMFKLFCCLIWIKEPCVRKFEGLTRSKILGILQTKLTIMLKMADNRWYAWSFVALTFEFSEFCV